jgi:rhodanese-related sulfurtransferase
MLKQIFSTFFGGRSEVVQNVSAAEAKESVVDDNVQFIDVRSAAEYNLGHAARAKNFPLDRLAADLSQLDKDKPVYVICQSGMRSLRGAAILENAGFKKVYNVSGGTIAWRYAGFETVA